MRIYYIFLVSIICCYYSCKSSEKVNQNIDEYTFHIQLKADLVGEKWLIQDESVIKNSIKPISKSQNSYRFKAWIPKGQQKEYMSMWKKKKQVVSISVAKKATNNISSGTNTGMSKTKPIKQ